MGKSITVRMTDKVDSKVYQWHVRHMTATNITLGQKPRKISGWAFTDHEGCERFSEGTWNDLIPMFRMVADNYGFSTTLS